MRENPYKMPDGLEILIGGLIGGPLILLIINLQYHLVGKMKDKDKDKQLRERLNKIQDELFEFENKK